MLSQNHRLSSLSLSLLCASSVFLYSCSAFDKNEVVHQSQTPSPSTTVPGSITQGADSTDHLASNPANQLTTEAETMPVPSGINQQAHIRSRQQQTLHESDAAVSLMRVKPKMAKMSAYAGHSVMAGQLSMPAEEYFYPGYEQKHRENYDAFIDNEIFKVTDVPVSTFSIDVDTGSYSNVRRFLNQGQLPQKHAVRAEELINYFSYSYEYPQNKQQPFSVNTEIAPTPWNKHSHLLRIGLQAYQDSHEQRPASNLVFLVDVSGSMQSKDKLELLKSGLGLLASNLNENDRISIVSYAGSTGVVLKPTRGDQTAKIKQALKGLYAGGGTNGASGIELAYNMAQQSYIEGGVNRIILATDGDFNVGVTDFETLKQRVEQQRKSGVSLTTLGFGTGNYNDHLMEQLADAGNGNYSYIDNLSEARKVLVEEMKSTLNTVANDVKIQIEFNPAQVAEYRLIGYENRALKKEDFNNDKVDAGDIGENHSVTALYEVTFVDSTFKQLDDSRYTQKSVQAKPAIKHTNELAFLKLRYKSDFDQASQLIEVALKRKQVRSLANTSDDFRFAASVAAFAQQLRGGKYLKDFDYNDILQLAKKSRGEDPYGYRGEFLQLVALAKSLDG